MELKGRPDPPTEAGEKETLTGFLDFQRATLRWKVDGLTPEQLGVAAVEPSTMTLHGLVRHLTEVELGWFVGTFTDEPVVHAYSSDERPDGDWAASTRRSTPTTYAGTTKRWPRCAGSRPRWSPEISARTTASRSPYAGCWHT
jgi:hypothetical protein